MMKIDVVYQRHGLCDTLNNSFSFVVNTISFFKRLANVIFLCDKSSMALQHHFNQIISRKILETFNNSRLLANNVPWYLLCSVNLYTNS